MNIKGVVRVFISSRRYECPTTTLGDFDFTVQQALATIPEARNIYAVQKQWIDGRVQGRIVRRIDGVVSEFTKTYEGRKR